MVSTSQTSRNGLFCSRLRYGVGKETTLKTSGIVAVTVAAAAALSVVAEAVVFAAVLDLSTAKLTINEQGVATAIVFSDGVQWPSSGSPSFSILAKGQPHPPKSIAVDGDRWTVRYANGVTAEFQVTCGQGFAIFRLNKLEPRDGITHFWLFNLAHPDGAHVINVLNAGTKDGHFVAVMSAEPNVYAVNDAPKNLLRVETSAQHGIEPVVFGVIACLEADRFDAIERFQVAAGIPSPRPGGVWSKKSPWCKQSYLLLTRFRESEFDEALAIARRGGFSTILLEQHTWSLGMGHYQTDPERFPDGLVGLKRTLQRFKDAGFRVGLHCLPTLIYPPDPYLTPVPDPRLLTGVSTTLAADIDAQTTILPVEDAPVKFPVADRFGYGPGDLLRVGDELIFYYKLSLEPPFGIAECIRGYYGTKPAAHKKGDRVVNLIRKFNTPVIDMDTSLLDEVAGHFAKVANTCGIDMIYFDGSELVQGDHRYYVSRLHKVFYDKLENKNTFLQASTLNHYSWHLMARHASADGHGDLKGYFEQRSHGVESRGRDVIPQDIGWYYGYDVNATPDEYEYILGATIGYDSSMSFQVSCEAAANHPFTGEILDLIARYEKLRLSGRVSEVMRQRLRIDPALQGKKTPEDRAKLLDRRRDYRLVGPEGHEYFQRLVYEPWREMKTHEAKNAAWTVRVAEPHTRIGVQIHAQTGPGLDNQTLVDPFVEVGGKRWEWKGELRTGQYVFFWPDEPVTRYGLPLKQPERLPENAAAVMLPVGEHTVRFGCRGASQVPVRVRVTLQPPERHPIPERSYLPTSVRSIRFRRDHG